MLGECLNLETLSRYTCMYLLNIVIDVSLIKHNSIPRYGHSESPSKGYHTILAKAEDTISHSYRDPEIFSNHIKQYHL